MRRLLVLIALLLALPLGAQQPRLRYALAPLQLTGDYQPISGADFTQHVLQEAKAKSPDVAVELIDPKLVQGWSDFMPPDPAQVQALASKLKVDRIAWGTVRFRTESHLMRQGGGAAEVLQGQNAVAYRYVVTVAGAADIRVADGKTGELLLDQPFAIFRSDVTAAPEGTFGGLEKELALQCSADLAHQIIAVGKKRLNP